PGSSDPTPGETRARRELMIEHFAMGWVTPVLSFLLSCAGCAVGLTCTARARVSRGAASTGWLALGAVANGDLGHALRRDARLPRARYRDPLRRRADDRQRRPRRPGRGARAVHRPRGGRRRRRADRR